MKRPTDPFLHDIFAEEGLAPETLLERSLASYRKGRRRRLAARAARALPLAAVLAWLAWPGGVEAPRQQIEEAAAPPATEPAKERYVPGTSVRIIGDEELLRLLDGRPVALVNTPRGKQVILFDEPAASR